MVETTNSNPIKGYDVFYFTQSVDAPIGSAAILPAHRTDGGMTIGGEDLDEQSAQGRIILKGTDEDSIELTQYVVPDDPSYDFVEDAKREGKNVKVWRVMVHDSVREESGADGEPTYPAHFGYGRPGEIEFTDGDSLSEITYPLNIVGGGLKRGRFPLSDEDIETLHGGGFGYENPGETTGDFNSQQTEDTGTADGAE